eukprot:4475812-Prymnesium_polylepis.1
MLSTLDSRSDHPCETLKQGACMRPVSADTGHVPDTGGVSTVTSLCGLQVAADAGVRSRHGAALDVYGDVASSDGPPDAPPRPARRAGTCLPVGVGLLASGR